MKINDEKVETKRASLGTDWIVVEGTHAITTAEFKDDGDEVTFNPARGILVKTFVNQTTGEIKFFPVIFFKAD